MHWELPQHLEREARDGGEGTLAWTMRSFPQWQVFHKGDDGADVGSTAVLQDESRGYADAKGAEEDPLRHEHAQALLAIESGLWRLTRPMLPDAAWHDDL